MPANCKGSPAHAAGERTTLARGMTLDAHHKTAISASAHLRLRAIAHSATVRSRGFVPFLEFSPVI